MTCEGVTISEILRERVKSGDISFCDAMSTLQELSGLSMRKCKLMLRGAWPVIEGGKTDA